ncbi:hypothetical protein FACS1894125_4480 [Actinomycetota bacterium]|nr:hypothetical protein FACS1894125_4480 [Actinomycetota bacterium]
MGTAVREQSSAPVYDEYVGEGGISQQNLQWVLQESGDKDRFLLHSSTGASWRERWESNPVKPASYNPKEEYVKYMEEKYER